LYREVTEKHIGGSTEKDNLTVQHPAKSGYVESVPG